MELVTYQQQWRRLYSWARKSRDINPNMQADMLRGTIRPCLVLTQMLDRIGYRAA